MKPYTSEWYTEILKQSLDKMSALCKEKWGFVQIRMVPEHNIHKTVREFYPDYTEDEVNALSERILKNVDGTTLLQYHFTEGGDTEDDDIISDIESCVVVNYQRVLNRILGGGMTFDQGVEYCMLILKHECGHVIDLNQRVVGMTRAAINNLEQVQEKKKAKVIAMDKANIDAGMDVVEAHAQFLEAYHALPIERRADEVFGITWQEFHYFKSLKGENQDV